MQPKLKVLDLFAGIGGFSLGLERTGGFETVAFCEINPFKQKVLKKHWPNVPIVSDVKKLSYDRRTQELKYDGEVIYVGSINIITGGFPCQDISTASRKKRKGIDGARSGLWSEIVRLAGEIRPTFVLVENSTNLLAGPDDNPGRWFGEVLTDMAQQRFYAEWYRLPLAAFGAPHTRPRVWVTFTDTEKVAGVYEPIHWERIRERLLDHDTSWPACPWDAPEACVLRVDDELPDRIHRSASIGDAIGPDCAELHGWGFLDFVASPQYVATQT